MPSDSVDLAALGARLFKEICEVPALNVLKPIAGVIVILCETVAVRDVNLFNEKRSPDEAPADHEGE